MPMAASVAWGTAVGLGAPAVGGMPVAVTADHDPDFINGAAAGTAAVGNTPGRRGGMAILRGGGSGREHGKSRDDDKQGD